MFTVFDLKVDQMMNFFLKPPKMGNVQTHFSSLQHSEWSSCNRTQMSMMDAIVSLDQLVDESDPDVDFPNSFHAFQTAEGIRQAHPDKGALQEHRMQARHVRTVKNLWCLLLLRLVPAGGPDP